MPHVHAASSLVLLLSIAAAARAASVEFRIIERTGQTAITSAGDSVLDFAVQARVVGDTVSGMSRFSFNIVAPGESDSFGTLSRLRITAGDHPVMYVDNPTQSDAPGSAYRRGLPFQYTSLSVVDPSFNGLLNTSGGTFTNNPGQQEIGMVGGFSTQNELVGALDGDFDGIPDTGIIADPTPFPTGPVWYGDQFFGSNGYFIDVYRFKYTITTLSQRTVSFSLQNVQATIFSQMAHPSMYDFSPIEVPTSATQSGISIPISLPAPGASVALTAAAICALRRRRRNA